jgi:hypothetical protein
MLAAMALARRLGSNGMTIDKLVEIAIETRAIEDMAQILPQLSPDYLRELPRRLYDLPRSLSGREMLLAEGAYAKKSAREQGGNIILISMADGVEAFYNSLGDAIDKPPAEFEAAVDAEMEKSKLNTLVQIAGASIKRTRRPLAEVEVRRDMLQVAIAFLQKGQPAIDASHDPAGNGPYQYSKTSNGFVLTSVPKSDAANVSLRVGRN